MSQEGAKVALEQMAYGLYIIGSRSPDGETNGMMADWVMQVSFDPILVAVAFENDAHTLENVRSSQVFSVNVLAQDAMELARKFAQPYYAAKVKGRPEAEAAKIYRKLEGIEYTAGQTGCPILAEAMAWFECQAEQFLPAGDHTLVIGRVVAGGVLKTSEPLTSKITGWTYGG